MRLRTPALQDVARAGAIVTLILGASAAALHAQQSDDEWLDNCHERQSQRETHCLVKVQRVEAGGTLVIDAGQNGGVAVYGTDRTDVEVHARIQAWAPSSGDAESLAGDVRLDLGRGSVRADGPAAGRREGWSVSFVVYVPRRSDLDLRAHNGPVSAADVAGAIEARTQNGPVSLRGVSGEVNARTQNGPLNVELAGSRWDGEGLDAETRNGPVRLTIPDGYNAKLETGTVNGPFDTDVPLQVTLMGRQRSRRIEATLGSGGPLIRAITTNGPVVIRKK